LGKRQAQNKHNKNKTQKTTQKKMQKGVLEEDKNKRRRLWGPGRELEERLEKAVEKWRFVQESGGWLDVAGCFTVSLLWSPNKKWCSVVLCPEVHEVDCQDWRGNNNNNSCCLLLVFDVDSLLNACAGHQANEDKQEERNKKQKQKQKQNLKGKKNLLLHYEPAVRQGMACVIDCKWSPSDEATLQLSSSAVVGSHQKITIESWIWTRKDLEVIRNCMLDFLLVEALTNLVLEFSSMFVMEQSEEWQTRLREFAERERPLVK
jgi:hypothetical protein